MVNSILKILSPSSHWVSGCWQPACGGPLTLGICGEITDAHNKNGSVLQIVAQGPGQVDSLVLTPKGKARAEFVYVNRAKKNI
jgi:hypothetical protein